MKMTSNKETGYRTGWINSFLLDQDDYFDCDAAILRWNASTWFLVHLGVS